MAIDALLAAGTFGVAAAGPTAVAVLASTVDAFLSPRTFAIADTGAVIVVVALTSTIDTLLSPRTVGIDAAFLKFNGRRLRSASSVGAFLRTRTVAVALARVSPVVVVVAAELAEPGVAAVVPVENYLLLSISITGTYKHENACTVQKKTLFLSLVLL